MVLACVWMCVLTHLHVNKEHDNNNEKPNQKTHKTAVTLLHLFI